MSLKWTPAMWLLLRYPYPLDMEVWFEYRLPIDIETVKRNLRDDGVPVIAVARRKVAELLEYD